MLGLRSDHDKTAAEFLTWSVQMISYNKDLGYHFSSNLVDHLERRFNDTSLKKERTYSWFELKYIIFGEDISFEDIRDADPYLYSGCKKILEMDTKMVDGDILGLTFVCEDERIGIQESCGVCPNGKNTIVNTHFDRGFADIITDRRLQKSLFRILDHEDLNMMLHGSKIVVSVVDWKEHTNYNGYKKMILKYPGPGRFLNSFKIVGSMSAEQRNVLLFFWTSIKSLPIEGFGGLDSKL
ncbi:hypothetical protein KY290_036815 [Solanum tuberosum]|uniref:HECT-type E3 ubiquitin transferase n=1 Tax=Solanum tuberosum TaxID=4113 RepID=A0ABQ7TXK7_SOLTU|nr:hypothetical protein KY289_036292 [Solanum tuberosum]KAH0639548.1 hypothetical protein KY285_036134 [Solanum tuberosum]KAH0738110.1 hypothetical protein KY290_036815 [Solanum tuberosum]